MRTLVGIVGLSLLGGCIAGLGDSSSNVEGNSGGGGSTIEHDGCKIEGSVIGREGYVLRLGAKTVTFHDWVTKAGESNEYVGFSITLGGATSIGYVVKSGGEKEHSTSLTWMHAAGPDGGDKAPAISNVDFCEECTDGSCGDGDGGGGDGGGGGDDDGDGCIEGCDDGSGGDDGNDNGDGDAGDGNCFEPGGCDGRAPTDAPPQATDGGGDDDDTVLL